MGELKTVNDIPEEVLEEIFKYLPTTSDLLETARQVSRKWNTVASSICRHRLVKLSYGIQSLEDEDFTSIFPSRNMPWSYVEFTEKGGPFSFPSSTRYHPWVLKVFGGLLWGLKSDRQTWEDLLHFLQFTPNLRALVLTSSDELFPAKITTTLHLPLLKYLKINITPGSLYFLRFLFNNCGVRLDKIKLKVILNKVNVETVKELTSLLRTFSVPTIFLKIYYGWADGEAEIMSVFGVGNITLRKLNLDFEEPQVNNDTLLATAGRILATSSQTLRSLKIICYLDTGKCTGVLQFPTLSALKVLKIRFSETNGEASTQFPGRLFSVAETKNFPLLEKIVLRYSGSGDWDSANGPEVFNAKLCKFDTVTELEFSDEYSMADWPQLFPNIKKLKANVTKKGLVHLLKNMQNIESLDLCVYPGQYNLNSILSGVPGADEVYVDEENEEIISNLRAVYGRPSLLSFPHLKTFKLDCSFLDAGLRDSGASLAILPLEPLNLLCLTDVIISGACEERLRERHRVVNVKRNTQNLPHD